MGLEPTFPCQYLPEHAYRTRNERTAALTASSEKCSAEPRSRAPAGEVLVETAGIRTRIFGLRHRGPPIGRPPRYVFMTLSFVFCFWGLRNPETGSSFAAVAVTLIRLLRR